MDIKIMHSVVFPTYVGEEKMNLAPPIRSEGGKVINSLIIIYLILEMLQTNYGNNWSYRFQEECTN